MPSLIGADETVKVITDAPAEALSATVYKNGRVRICNTTSSVKDDKGNYQSTLDAIVAVEVTDTQS